MLKRNHAGFTLIEVIISLAIAATLIPIVIAGQRQIRERAQFLDSIERVDQAIRNVKNEANTTVNTSGNGTNTNSLVVGKMMQFQLNSSTINVWTIRCLVTAPQSGQIGCDQPEVYSFDTTFPSTPAYSISIPWNAKFVDPLNETSGNGRYVIFLKNSVNGDLSGYISSNTWSTGACGGLNILNPSNFKNTGTPCSWTGPSAAETMHYTNASSFTADIHFDPASMSVTRTIN